MLWFKGDRASNRAITDAFLSALPAIDTLTAELHPPSIIKITPAGRAEQVYP